MTPAPRGASTGQAAGAAEPPGLAGSASPGAGRSGLGAGFGRTGADAGVSAAGESAARLSLTRWVGWRLRVLMALALGSCVLVFVLMRMLADQAQLPLHMKAVADGKAPAVFLASTDAAAVRLLTAADGTALMPPPGAATLPRWQSDDEARAAQLQWQRKLRTALAQGPLKVTLADGQTSDLSAHTRGFAGLGAWFWPLAMLALMLVLLGAVVVLAQPHAGNALFALLAWSQALALMQQAALTLPGLLLPPTLLALDLPLRSALDLLGCAAVVHALALYPRRLARWRWVVAMAWGLAVVAVLLAPLVTGTWWWLQGAVLLLAGSACWVAYRARPAAQGAVQRLTRRLVSLGLGSLILLSLLAAGAALNLAGSASGLRLDNLLRLAVPVWQLFLAGLLLAPLLLRSRQMMREFALLASISAVAASLDLLFVAVFSLSAFTSLALVVFIALGLYAGLRQWLFDRLAGSSVLTTERVFEQLYRAARAVQAEPDRQVDELAHVLRDLFEPLEVLQSARPVPQSRVAGSGVSLLVPVPSLGDSVAAAASGATLPAGVPRTMGGGPQQQAMTGVPRTSPGGSFASTASQTGQTGHAGPAYCATLVLRHARRGQRVFTQEDVRLADRVVEQLRRAVAYDLAVERGRGEERLRIAQDLHDDIGARLLTLMYQSPTPEMEDYVRQTLKDLKTLTRGLAASEHRLSHAMAEWRADIEQRCSAAHVELDWAVQVDQDVRMGMVAWSGLTRVLRELVSNVLHHARATRLTVRLRLLNGEFNLRVSDDGEGQMPEQWAQGLGLGGIRKRVKLLGGTVHWRQGQTVAVASGDAAQAATQSLRGITCEVRVQNFGAGSA